MYKGSRAPKYDARTAKQKACEHRWDHLAVVGGWGAGGTVQLHCEECNLYLHFDIDDAYPESAFQTDNQHRLFNDKAVKFDRYHPTPAIRARKKLVSQLNGVV